MDSGDPPAVLDLSQLRGVTLDDETLMREIVHAVVADAGTQLQALQEALSRADTGKCARLAHSARGACGNVGATALAAAFASVEEVAQSGRAEECRALLDRLASELERLRRAAGEL